MRILFPVALFVGSNIGMAFAATQADPVPTVPATPRSSASVPALPPPPESPIRYFRELLAETNNEALDQMLASKPEAQRTVLKAKLKEYAAMPEEERERRLRATELRWFLRPMMELAPANRTQWLTAVPKELQGLINDRLAQWDRLAPEVRKEVLENDWIMQYLPLSESGNAIPQVALLNKSSPELRARIEKEMARWQSLSTEQRQRMCGRFQQFFDLPPKEKERTLRNLSEVERNQMKQTLQTFANLPPVQRRLCLDSFSRFAGMTPEERSQFLRNVERWKEMTPDERQKWRTLVTQLPPLPPGLGRPPLPPSVPRTRASADQPAQEINLTNAAP